LKSAPNAFGVNCANEAKQKFYGQLQKKLITHNLLHFSSPLGKDSMGLNIYAKRRTT
jgi:hypothetical protein